jgi:hypothetical protein
MSQKRIFWFWLPLFASWLLMTAEGPFITAVINRLPEEVIMLAAQGIVYSLAVLIESPIINLLATSTALVKDRPSYLILRRFTIQWMVGLTLISVLVAFTPLFDLIVVQILQTPPEIARWVRPGMQIMTLWSAAIAWRRFLQGVLIHYDHTRRIAWGTIVRLIASGGSALVLGLWSGWPGIIIGTSALMAGVIAEALYATLAVRSILRDDLAPDSPVEETDILSYRGLFWFHLPLAATSILSLLAQPMVTSSLARLNNPTLSLAAWPVMFQLTLLMRAAAFAWPEVVIALSKGKETFPPLRKFSVNMSAVLTLLMLLFAFTPMAAYYIYVIQDMTAPVGALVQATLPLFLFFPLLAVFTSFLRGLLINKRVTKWVNTGMALNLVITAVILIGGVALSLPGLPTAAAALNLAALAEVIYLAWRTAHVLAPEIRLFSMRDPLPSSA